MTNSEYQEALEWLYQQMPNYQIDGIKAYKPGLQNISALCSFFENPQEHLKMVHIAGTNGKGSTSNMLASILQEMGYKVGLFNSPHLIDFTERIKVNGENCSKTFVFDFIGKLKNLPPQIRPSFFEFTTIMAFQYFYEQKVDIAIIETGLGGRLDSTNIINPIATAITNVQLDHQDILGDSIEKIAVEKAGIIKKGVPVLSGDENPAVKEIIYLKAKEKQALFIDVTNLSVEYECDLKGLYQKKNMKVVLGVINVLRYQNFLITDESIRAGFAHIHRNTGFMGRWFIFSQSPLVICDTAHNQAGLEMVFEQLNADPKYKHILLGFVQEKKIDEVLSILPKNASFYFAKPYVNRGRDPHSYEDLLKKSKIKYQIFENIQGAYLSALQRVKKDEMIFVGGSNFIVGEFLEKNLQK